MSKQALCKLSPTGSSARNSMGHRPPLWESWASRRLGDAHYAVCSDTWMAASPGDHKVSGREGRQGLWVPEAGEEGAPGRHPGAERVAPSTAPVGVQPGLCPEGRAHQRFTRKTCSISCRISSSRNTLRTSSRSMHCCLFMYFMAYIFSVSRFCTIHTWRAERASARTPADRATSPPASPRGPWQTQLSNDQTSLLRTGI